MPGKRGNISRQIILYYCIASVIFFLDRLSKFFITGLFQQGSSVPIIKDIFHTTLVYNTGAAFGLLKNFPYLFVIIAVFVFVLINYFLIRKFYKLSVAERIALTFMLGGTLGNLVDRICFGYVIDFIDFRIWPVFNVADSFITIGALMLGLSILCSRKHNSLAQRRD